MSTDDAPASTYPALRNLEKAQQEVAEDLREGFRTTDDLFFWLQDLVVVSFGYVKTDMLQEAYNNRAMRKCLMTGEDFTISFEHLNDIDPWKCREFRLMLEEDLNGPFQSAYRDLRANANEYVDPGNRPDPTAEHVPVALRPSLEQLRERQEETLRELLDGFEESEEILDWARRLNAATHGELPRKLITGMRGPEKHLRHQLLNDDDLEYAGDHRDEFRYHFACTYLLPAFNDGVRAMTGAAGETTDDEDESDGFSDSVGV
jgi:hypothetical protein